MEPLDSPSRPRRRRWRFIGAGVGVLALVALVTVGVIAWRSSAAGLEVTGPDGGRWLGEPDLESLEFRAEAEEADALTEAALFLDGREVTDQADIDGSTVVYRPGDLDEGEHRLELVVEGGVLRGSLSHEWLFAVDTTPPEITVTEPTDEVAWGEPMHVAGTVDESALLRADGDEVDVDGGRFAVDFEQPPAGPVVIEAVDEFGNSTAATVEVEVAPREPPGMRSVHVTAHAWASEELREPILDMVEAGLINSVELDIKDEDGAVGYDSDVPLAQETGAAQGFYDLDEAVATLREHDVHIVGRIVAFADPILARWAWEGGERDKVIQTPGGDMYTGSYAGFANFADEEIRQYNIDLALEAAEAGFDDILYDYVRRPDGSLDNMHIPGLEGSPEEGIVEFLAEAREQLAEHRVWLGASVYGIAADRPTEIGQDIPAIAEHVDYVAPMVYPSHWGPGEYGVEDPNNQPYDIVHASLQVFEEAIGGTEARIVPWLQDFSLGAAYGPEQVRAQIEAAADLGIEEFLLWNAGSRYTRAALEEGAEVVGD